MQCDAPVLKKQKQNRAIYSSLSHSYSTFSLLFWKKNQIWFDSWFSSCAWNHHSKDTNAIYIWFKPVKYITVQQSRQTISAKLQNINLVFCQICYSSHKHFPTYFMISISVDWDWKDGYIHKLLCHLEISLPWNRKDYTTLCSNSLALLALSFLKYWPLRLTFSIFLASLFTASYFIYQFPHLTGKDFSKLIDHFNTKYHSMWPDSKTAHKKYS